MIEGNSSSRGSRTGMDPTSEASRPYNREATSRKMQLQLVLAVVLAVFGMLLFIVAFIVPPTGIIDSSVLVAGGEVFTFAGSLLGLDYRYRYKQLSE